MADTAYLVQPKAWIVSFGPVGAGSDGYLVRVEGNVRALVSLGFSVDVLEISPRTEPTTPWPNVRTHPGLPGVLRSGRIQGPLDPLAELQGQLALAAGLIRHWRDLRSADLVVIEGGLLAPALVTRLFCRKRPKYVFDLHTLMSSLHRDRNGVCTFECKARRLVWRLLEFVCVRASDATITCSSEDVEHLHTDRARVVPHTVPVGESTFSEEKPNLIGFLGSGLIAPNREAVDFITSTVLKDPALAHTRLLVIGEQSGYSDGHSERTEFVGFREDLAEALGPVSVCCAPMHETGGTSTKVLAYLLNGKRTVSTSEAARGFDAPPYGLWISDRENFAQSVIDALAQPWTQGRSTALRSWMSSHQGFEATEEAWTTLVAALTGPRGEDKSK